MCIWLSGGAICIRPMLMVCVCTSTSERGNCSSQQPLAATPDRRLRYIYIYIYIWQAEQDGAHLLPSVCQLVSMLCYIERNDVLHSNRHSAIIIIIIIISHCVRTYITRVYVWPQCMPDGQQREREREWNIVRTALCTNIGPLSASFMHN